MRKKERERERKRGDLNHLSVHQWLRSAIRDSQQPTSPIGFLFLRLPPPPCAVLLVSGRGTLTGETWQSTTISGENIKTTPGSSVNRFPEAFGSEES